MQDADRVANAKVTSFEWRKDASGSEYTAYLVNIQTDASEIVIPKRFSEFQKLYKPVAHFLGQYTFPSTLTWGKLSDASLERRRVQLGELLVALLEAAEEHEECRQAINDFVRVEPANGKEPKTEANSEGYYTYMQQLGGYMSSSPAPAPAITAAPSPSPSPAQPAASDAYFSRMAQYWSPNVGVDWDFWFPASQNSDDQQIQLDEDLELDTDEDSDEEMAEEMRHKVKIKERSSFNRSQLVADDKEDKEFRKALQRVNQTPHASSHAYLCVSLLDVGMSNNNAGQKRKAALTLPRHSVVAHEQGRTDGKPSRMRSEWEARREAVLEDLAVERAEKGEDSEEQQEWDEPDGDGDGDTGAAATATAATAAATTTATAKPTLAAVDAGSDDLVDHSDSDDSDIFEEAAEFDEDEFGEASEEKAAAEAADDEDGSAIAAEPAVEEGKAGDAQSKSQVDAEKQEVEAAKEEEEEEWVEYKEEDADKHPSWHRFVAGCKGKTDVARSRWVRTMNWRREQKVDKILTQKQPHFAIIKQFYPHCYHGRSKDGWPVYFERPAGINLPALIERGVTMPDLLRHNMYVTEFQWQKLQGDTEEKRQAGKSMTVMDMKGASFKDVGPDKLEFIKAIAAYRGAHYPERAAHIFIVNVPIWFSTVWAMVCPFIDPKTVSKTHIVSAGWSGRGVSDALLKHIDADQLPKEYGGSSPFKFGEDKETEMKLLENAEKYLESGW